MSQKILEAIRFALEAHGSQKRKGSQIPYIVHPVAVAEILGQFGAKEEVVIAGVLHDLLEDTDVEEEVLENRFGPQVLKLVQASSEPGNRAGMKAPWRERKWASIERLNSKTQDELFLYCADKFHNLESMRRDLLIQDKDSFFERFNAPYDEQKWYYHALLSKLEQLSRDSGLKRLVWELKKSFSQIFD